MVARAPIAPTEPAAMPDGLRDAILAWYDARGRSLPFRGTTDPYAVLVSEVMAQQTQISRVAVAWAAFMATFPTIADLAAASPADVLRAWSGMGYNRRALNLWRAARTVVEEHDGVIPTDIASLERLSGIGPYTARAVAAIAFAAPVGAVDTNVRRVLNRAVGGGIDAFHATELQRIADSVVPADRPADWTHALMDIGATFCRTTRPRCADCPALTWCRYAAVPGSEPAPDGADVTGTRSTPPRGAAFETTSRWLRGRILERLREVDGAGWAQFGQAIGGHDHGQVIEAVRRLAGEGLLELDTADPRRARLPVS
jgi:A/G-specific adenine glycosylase